MVVSKSLTLTFFEDRDKQEETGKSQWRKCKERENIKHGDLCVQLGLLSPVGFCNIFLSRSKAMFEQINDLFYCEYYSFPVI